MKITIERDIIMTHIGDEAVLLNIKNGRYFSLNRTGERVWGLLKQYEDAEKVLTVMMDEFDVDENILRHDIKNIILGLSDAELVIPA